LLVLALSTSMPVLPAIALATARALTVSSSATTTGGEGGGAAEEELAGVSVVVDVVEGFADVFVVARGACCCCCYCCPLLRSSLAAGTGACRRCARIASKGREREREIQEALSIKRVRDFVRKHSPHSSTPR